MSICRQTTGLNRSILALLIAALVTGPLFVLAAPAATAQGQALDTVPDAPREPAHGDPARSEHTYFDYTFAECSQADEKQVQAEIETIAAGVLGEAAGNLDIQTLVDRKWRELGTAVIFAEEVDAAIARVRAEQSYWDRLWSGWSPDKATEFAEQTATYTFESPRFAQALEALAEAIAAGLVLEIEAMTTRSASSALLCLQAYVGDAYSDTLFALFREEIGAHVQVDGLTLPTDMEISPLEMRSNTLYGAGVIIGSQVAARLAQGMGQKMAGRLAGKVATRVLGRLGATVIPYIGWAVGAGLIIWDLWEGAEGALPQIREALISDEVQQSMRAEIAAELTSELRAETASMAALLATTLTGAWQTFCTAHELLCALTANNAAFRLILEATPLAQIEALAALAGTWVEVQGRVQLETALADGSFGRLATAPDAARPILAWSGSPETTLAWAQAAAATGQPDALNRIVQAEIYRTLAPDALPVEQLATIVTIDDNLMLNKLIALEPGALESLLVWLPTESLTAIAEDASSSELSWLAGYLSTLDASEIDEVVRRLVHTGLSLAALQAQQHDAQTSAAALSDVAPQASRPLLPGVRLPGIGNADGSTQNGWDGSAPVVETISRLLQANGVLIAALILLVLAIGAGAVLAVHQREISGSD